MKAQQEQLNQGKCSYYALNNLLYQPIFQRSEMNEKISQKHAVCFLGCCMCIRSWNYG